MPAPQSARLINAVLWPSETLGLFALSLRGCLLGVEVMWGDGVELSLRDLVPV